MSVTDPIADLFTRMRNANQMRYNEVVVPSSNLKLEIVNRVEIRAQKTAVKGNLDVNVSDGYVTITSEGGAVSTGNTEINASAGSVTLKANGDAATIEGNAKINARGIYLKSANNAAIAGDTPFR